MIIHDVFQYDGIPFLVVPCVVIIDAEFGTKKMCASHRVKKLWTKHIVCNEQRQRINATIAGWVCLPLAHHTEMLQKT